MVAQVLLLGERDEMTVWPLSYPAITVSSAEDGWVKSERAIIMPPFWVGLLGEGRRDGGEGMVWILFVVGRWKMST